VKNEVKKMKKIGQRISEVRKEKGLKQAAVYNQSTLSQIESGKITNPDQNTLEGIAQGLDLELSELVEGTDWKYPEKKLTIHYYALSPIYHRFNYETLMLEKIKPKPFLIRTDDKLNFDAETGLELIKTCSNCDRFIDSPTAVYCPGCGTPYYFDTLLEEVLPFFEPANRGRDYWVIFNALFRHYIEDSTILIKVRGELWKTLHEFAQENGGTIIPFDVFRNEKMIPLAFADEQRLDILSKMKERVRALLIEAKVDTDSIIDIEKALVNYRRYAEFVYRDYEEFEEKRIQKIMREPLEHAFQRLDKEIAREVELLDQTSISKSSERINKLLALKSSLRNERVNPGDIENVIQHIDNEKEKRNAPEGASD
jgi:transcriptional regulator with XRE-family HTH domain